MEKITYVAYGSNMVKAQMAYRCPDAILLGTGYIENARLEFYLHATVVRCSGEEKAHGSVPVAVWQISEQDLLLLDRYEGVPTYYQKETWPVVMADGSRINGLVYVMKKLRVSPPAEGYYDAISRAYAQLGFEAEIDNVLYPALMRSLFRHHTQAVETRIYAVKLDGGFYLIGRADNTFVTVDPESMRSGPLKVEVNEICDLDVIRQFGWRIDNLSDIDSYASRFGVYEAGLISRSSALAEMQALGKELGAFSHLEALPDTVLDLK